MDAVKNFAIVEVSTGYNSSATSVALSSGEGAKLPQPSSDGEFNLVWWNSTDYPNPADDPNVEIVRVTARSTDTLTIVRPASGNSYNNEGSSNTSSAKNTSGKTYKMMLSFTKKVINDITSTIKTGWVSYKEVTPTRASADDPTYVLTFSGVDLTSILSVGMRLKLTQNSIVRYAIITKVALNGSDTDVTLLTRCSDYTSSDADFDILDTGTYPITNVYYSSNYAPVGFELNADFWSIERGLSSYTNSSPSDGTWYSSGQSIDVPIGSWDLRGHLQVGVAGGDNGNSVTGCLSEDATNPISNIFTGVAMPVTNTNTKKGRVTVEGRRSYTSKTTVTALIKGNFYPSNLYLYSDTNNGYSTIKATSTYI